MNVVELKNITKIFSGVKVLDNVSFTLKKGEIHTLLGENGAGKSTLMKVLFGLYSPDNGNIFINEKRANIKNVNDANDLGIGMVHQHFKLVETFNILDNIIMGYEDVSFGFINRKKTSKIISQLSKDYCLDLNLKAKVENVSVGMQQRAEILKMLYRNNDILIFDEPTAVLTPQEIEQLMTTFKTLTKSGKSIIFISHKLNEIMSVSDRITILRRGKLIATVNKVDTNKEELSKMMVGREINLSLPKNKISLGREVLRVENLVVKSTTSKNNAVNNVSFSVNQGEIVCIAGIDGNGQSELAYAISGLMKTKSGSVFLNDKKVNNKSIRYLNDNGLAHVPENRLKYAIIEDDNLYSNLVMKLYHNSPFQKFGILNFKEIRNYGDELIDKYDIRSPKGGKTISKNMSGGNQQKAVIAREIEKDFDLFLTVQTVRGLDIGAVDFAHKKIVEQRNNGKAILMISFDLEEIMKVSDRILVMFDGEIVGNFNRNDVTVEELGLYMSGTKRMN